MKDTDQGGPEHCPLPAWLAVQSGAIPFISLPRKGWPHNTHSLSLFSGSAVPRIALYIMVVWRNRF